MHEAETKVTKNNYIYILDYLRLLAMTMVVYDHLGPFRNPNWVISKIIDILVCKPLYIIQDFGAFGVSLFFMISGFFFDDSVSRCSSIIKFLIKKIISLYVPLIVSFVLFWVLVKLSPYFTHGGDYWAQFSTKQWITSGTLIAYFTGGADVINGTTWFLMPLIIFTIISTPIFYSKMSPTIKILSLDFFILILCFIQIFLNNVIIVYSITQFGWYICIIMFGVIIHYLDRKKIGLKNGLILLTLNYSIMVLGVKTINPYYYSEHPYLISVIYALFLLVLCLLFQNKVKEKNNVVAFFVNISYCIYLTHMTFGSYLLTILENKLPYTICFIITIVVVVMVSYLVNKLIEKPSKYIKAKLKI